MGCAGTQFFHQFAGVDANRATVQALHDTLEQALADPAVSAGLRDQGYTLARQTPGQFQALIAADIDRYAAVTRALGLKAD